MNQAEMDRVLALAAIAQASECVYQLATTGKCSETDLDTLLDSLFIFDAPDTESIYGSAAGLKHGLEILSSLAHGHYHRNKSAEIIKYGFGLLIIDFRIDDIQPGSLYSNFIDAIIINRDIQGQSNTLTEVIIDLINIILFWKNYTF